MNDPIPGICAACGEEYEDSAMGPLCTNCDPTMKLPARVFVVNWLCGLAAFAALVLSLAWLMTHGYLPMVRPVDG